jgi:hypothetical protein
LGGTQIIEPGARNGAGVRRLSLVSAALLLALAIAAMGATKAGARGLTTGFTDDLFSSPNTSVRNTWLDRAKQARAGIIRISVNWRDSVGSNPPVTPTNPADPAYNFAQLDASVESARARGLDVMLTAYDAPAWAEGNNPPSNVNSGTWKPNPAKLKEFGEALSRRYSGSFLDLPRVRFFEAWTEPNLEEYLSPQWAHGRPVSPDRYRRMLNAFYQGVKGGQPKAKVIGGATAPYGDAPGGDRMRPLFFLKGVFCLDDELKPKHCGTKPHLDVLSHHPINFFTSPHHKAFNRNDVPIANFSRVRRLMHAAERTHHVLPKGRHPLWATEILWYTDPPTRFGVPVKKAARWLEEALYLLWKQGASVAINFEIRDLPYQPKKPRLPYSGVFFENGKKKPAYRAFRFPFVTHRKSHEKVKAWTKAPQSGKLNIQAKRHGHWQTKKKLRVHKGRVVSRTFRLKGEAKVRGKLKHSKSLPWHQGA